MNAFESDKAALVREGWFPVLRAAKVGWTCSLYGGAGVLPPNIPRPIAEGLTAHAALIEAVRLRDKMRVKAA